MPICYHFIALDVIELVFTVIYIFESQLKIEIDWEIN